MLAIQLERQDNEQTRHKGEPEEAVMGGVTPDRISQTQAGLAGSERKKMKALTVGVGSAYEGGPNVDQSNWKVRAQRDPDSDYGNGTF